jgi:hypothetical protein
MIAVIALYILLNLYAATSGVKDAILWSKTGAEAFKWNEHIIFVIERILICICLFLVLALQLYQLFIVVLAFFFSFSFWHNGFYYMARNRIEKSVYPMGFWSESYTSTSVLEFSTVQRSLLKIASLVGILLLII